MESKFETKAQVTKSSTGELHRVDTSSFNSFAVQLAYTDDTQAADDALAGVAKVNTLTFEALSAMIESEYLVIEDTLGLKWSIASSLAGIAEVTTISALADISAVAEVTTVSAIAEGAVKEITSIACVADVDDSLDKKYFILQDEVGSVGFWYDIDDSGTQVDPELVALTDRQVEITTVATDDVIGTVGTATYNAIVGDSKFEAGSDDTAGNLLIQSSTYGVKSAAADGNSGFTTGENTAGVDSLLDGKYFVMQDAAGSVAFWMDVDNSGTAEPSHGADRSVEITTIATIDSAVTIGGLLRTAIGADSKFGTSGAGADCIVTNAEAQALPDAADGDSGFGFVTDTQGVTATASLDGTYFLLQDVDGSVAFWIDLDNSGTTIPSGAAAADRAVEITTIATSDSAATVGGKLRTAIGADSKFTTAGADADCISTNVDLKDLDDAADGDTGFGFNTDTQGSDLNLEPTGVIWLSIPAANKAQVDLSATTDAASVAAAFEVAFDALTDVPFATDDTADDGTMIFTQNIRGVVIDPVSKLEDDSGAGGISVVETTEGINSEVSVSGDSLNLAGHGLITGVKGQMSSTDTLPAGLAAVTDYFVIVIDEDNIQLASSLANALAGTEIDITDQGTSGATHTFTSTPLASSTIKIQESVDGLNWHDISGVVTSGFTADGQTLLQGTTKTNNIRSLLTLTAGQLIVDAIYFLKEI